MVKVQNSKDKDKTSLLQGSVQFSLIRQSCHWNHWQLCLSKKGQIGISVLLVCNLTTCRTWQERTTKGSTKSFSVLKATASLFSGIEINNYFGFFFLWIMFLSLLPLFLCTYTKIPYGSQFIVTQQKSLSPISIHLLPSAMPTFSQMSCPM